MTLQFPPNPTFKKFPPNQILPFLHLNMLILTGKLPLVFLFIFLYFVNTITLAQPHFIAYYCEPSANYASNSPYDRNLNTTLSTLPNTNSGFGFFNSSTDQGSDTVHSVALCRGDVNPDACRSCLNDSIARLRLICPNQKEAIGYYDNCMLKYSNQTILGSTQIKFHVNYTNPETASDVDRFNGALSLLLNNLTPEASTGGSLLKFATGNTPGPGFTNIYALVQCTPDLTQQQCNECLGDIISWFSNRYSGHIGGRTLVPMCNFRYEGRPFYNENTLASPPPPNLQGLSPSSGTNTSKTQTVIILTICVTVSVIILIGSICIFKRLRNKPQQTPSSDNTETVTMDIGMAEPFKYNFSRVKDATNDFAEENKLGKGGFGAVYKGKLEDGEVIAVKRLANDSRQGHKEFMNEVSAMKELRHRNLVRLLGYSIKGSERLLIYEFLPNASLDRFIFDPSQRPLLDWEKRYTIIKGIAKGLLYLHEDSPLKTIHLDMKACNVLLDDEMNPKIADFGLARLFKPKVTQGDASRIAGTPGYMAPEYAEKGKISVKSDVFSFGVLVLEMVTGQKNTFFQNGKSKLLSFAWNTWRNNTPLDMIDPTLKSTGSGSMHDTIRCIHIGLLCVQKNAVDRPTMFSVVHDMLDRYSITLQVPSRPAYFMHSSTDPEVPLLRDHTSSTGSSDPGKYKPSKSRSSQVSVNDVSLSEVVPR